MDEQEKNSKMKIASNLVWKKMPIKYKAITIVAATTIIFIFVFLLLIIAPLLSTGIIKSDDISSGYRGSSAFGRVKKDVYWWPIGSAETEEQNGFLLAKGDPQIITISNNYSDENKGIDISSEGADTNTINIIAVKPGVVTYPTDDSQTKFEDSGTASDGDGYGNYVKIRHSDGSYTLYAHLAKDSITVKADDVVEQGQVIGKMGRSGDASETKLHFEIRVGSDSTDSSVDPTQYIKADDPRPSSYGTTGGFSLNETVLSLNEFISKMNDYCQRSNNKNFCNNFANNSELVYQTSVENNVNPELVVVTAGTEQGWGNPYGSYNFWGIGVVNGSNKVGNYGSLENGIVQYAKVINDYSDPNSGNYNSIINRYNEREEAGCKAEGHGMPGTLEGMQSVYSWIGDHRYNPGGDGLGGCVYLNLIYGAGYCSSVPTCYDYNNCPSDSKTTVCEQNDYTAYQLIGKFKIRYDIFGL
jgi:hypothetical protein